MNVVLRIAPGTGAVDPEALFGTCFVNRRPGWRGFGLSIAAHAVVVYLGAAYAAFVATHPAPHEQPVDLASARILELDIARMRPYIPQQIQAPPKQAPPNTPKPGAPGAARVQPVLPQAPALEDNYAPAPRVARRFNAPQPVQPAKLPEAPETLIQLDLPQPKVEAQLQLPNALTLTNSPLRKLPRPVIRPPELPNREIPAQVILEADAPRIQAAAGELPIAAALTERAALPVMPASKSPVAGTGANPAEAATGNFKTQEAPVLVAAPNQPAPPRAAVVVPPTSQAAPGGSNGTDPAGGSRAAPQASAGAGAGSGKTETAGAAVGGASSQQGNLPIAPPRPQAALPQPVRVTLPRDGKYEVTVTQNAGIVPGSADFLSGRPVYSVYIHAGDKRDWILQYCLPATSPAPPRRSSTVVSLGPSPAPLAAPFAFVMLRPAVAFAAPDIRYAMVHGFVNENGRLEKLAEVGDRAIKNMQEVMDALAGWEFRPASKDGVAAAVEILLCIPNTAI